MKQATGEFQISWPERNAKALFILFFALAVLDIINTLVRFSFVYTDGDQAVLWGAAQDMAKGVFHGYCFYGQSYNPLIEPLLALPLLKLGFNVTVALPVIAASLGILPYLILSVVFYKTKGPIIGILPLAILLLLPPEFNMIISMPRGFTSGIFFTVLGLIILMSQTKAIYQGIAGFCFGLGLFASANSVLLLPLLIPLFFDNNRKIIPGRFYFIPGLCAGLVPLMMSKIFYNHHPGMVIHPSPDMGFNFHQVAGVLGSLDKYFNFVTPVFWWTGWMSFLAFFIIGIQLFKKRRLLEFSSVVILLSGIFLSFAMKKLTESTNSIYFSGARFFLAYPVLLVFILGWSYTELNMRNRKIFLYIIVSLSLVSFLVKISAFNRFAAVDLGPTKNTIVHEMKVKDLLETCRKMQNFSATKPGLAVAVSGLGEDKILNYGCPCLIHDFIPDMQLHYERRTWITPHYLDNIYPVLLLYGKDSLTWQRMNTTLKGIEKRDSAAHWLLIKNNTKKTGELLKGF